MDIDQEMSAKFMPVFTDRKPELKKQIGCMAGIFQIFDRHHLLSGRHLNGGSSHKRTPSGHALPKEHNVGGDRTAFSSLEKNMCKNLYENQRISMDSSRISFSTSPCSSFSSLEGSKSTQQELPSFDRPILPERSINASPKSLDFQETQNDTLYKGNTELSVKTSMREKVRSCVLKHIDSPRPPRLPEPTYGSPIIGPDRRPRMHVDLNESPRVLVKLKELPHNFLGAGEPPRSSYEAKDASLNPVPRDIRRFSCDGREISRTSLDSHEQKKPVSKHTDLSRLSLDSRVRSLRISNLNSEPRSILKHLDSTNFDQASANYDLQQDLRSPKRSPSVVVKLMGLETLPEVSLAAKDLKSKKDCHPFDAQGNSKSMSRASDTLITQVNNPDSLKPISNVKVPIKSTPWSQPDRDRVPHKLAIGYRGAQMKQPTKSVYSEFETRLKELEFQESNRDLRALKQILDSMHAKGLLDTKKDKEKQSGLSIGKTPTQRAFESPIVIMKPAKLVDKTFLSVTPLEGLSSLRKLRTSESKDKNKAPISNRTIKVQSPKSSPRGISNKCLLSADNKSIKKPEEICQQETQPKAPSSLSPRLNQRKLEKERNLNNPLPSSKPSRHQKPQSDRKPLESVSPRGKLRRKPTRALESDGQLSESSETRNPSRLADEVSERSYSNISSASQLDVEIPSSDRSEDTSLVFVRQCSPSSSERAANNSFSVLKQMKTSLSPNKEVSTLEIAASEQPSPVSVLNASFYQDELQHSPLKKVFDELKEDEVRPSDHCWHLMDSIDNLRQKPSSKINQKKFHNIENLVQKLSELSSNNGGSTATDHIASLWQTQNPDHRYVSEILLASGILLKDLGDRPIQLHSSGHPINPELFRVLEQTKSSRPSKPEETQPDHEKLHRKLVFDVVNEILIHKLELASQVSHVNRLPRPGKCMTLEHLNGQRLLKEVCLKIEQIQAESSMAGESELQRSEGLTDFGTEISGIVLDIERSIFKDLIDEVISTDASTVLQHKSSRRRRLLFA